ncbi:putative isochorismatase [Nocardia brasiliensis NBRC 14402]|uniref:isochorismatase family protein n=1 Tax=Nocardia brasiliensis TaxID=37326 RepID=UPI00030584C6|nr:isochorismatase family protein [Nocardia brasiliensis]ASF09486.1 2,3-dihydro-2,3-dihydroxybenzoate synthetase [Nocardia brasiliensis]GAJ86570.1 putative isochorismatase [Nocardia brasiliensis NBRC 14402]SUB39799.1 Isochorismatase [Nocardia brasiliensis]
MPLPESISYALPEALPPNIVDWTVDPRRAVVLIHDMQRYFIRRFDGSAEPISAVVRNIARIKRAAVRSGCPVIYTAQPGDQEPATRALLADFWGPGLSGAAEDTSVISELTPDRRDVTLTKWRYSAFSRTDLLRRLSAAGRDQLVITGVYAHIGCLATALDAFMHDVQVFLIADAVADFSRSHHEQALDYIASRCGAVVRTDDTVGHLRRAGAEPAPSTDLLEQQWVG